MKKAMKKAIVVVGAFFIALVVVYLTCSGVQWQWNPGLWDKDFRSGAFIGGALISVMAAGFFAIGAQALLD